MRNPADLYDLAKRTVDLAVIGADEDLGAPKATAAYFAMCYQLAIARVPVGPDREEAVLAAEYAEERMKLEAIEAAAPEFTPHG